MISAIYIFSIRGELLLQRVYAPPGPPHHHLKALARSLIAPQAFGQYAPVICVGSGSDSTSSMLESTAAVSCFTWFTPPRTGGREVSCSSPLPVSAASSPVSNSGTGPAACQASAAYLQQGGARRRYGAPSADEHGVIYVAALQHNGNVACALEVLRRLAALVQAFFTASVHAGGGMGGSSLHSASELSGAPSTIGATFRSQRGVSVDAGAARKRTADGKDAEADVATRGAKTSPSSWEKIRRGLSVPRESAAASRGKKQEIMGTGEILMPAASISPIIPEYTYGGASDASSRGGDGRSGSVTEAFIRNNFVLLHELLDEAVDGGFPQLLDLTALKQFIFVGSSRGIGNLVGSVLPAWAADLLGTGGGGGGRASSSQSTAGGAALGSSSSGPFGGLSLKRGGDKNVGALQDVLQSRKITMQVTGACAWRPLGIKYRSNEVFVDVVECVNVLIAQSGVVLRADVNGQVMVNCKLSGMPECKFGLNDRFLGGGGGGGSAAAGNQSGSGGAGAENANTSAPRRHTRSNEQQQPGRHPSSQASAKQFSEQTAGHAAALGPAGTSPSARAQERETPHQQHSEPRRAGGVVLDDCRFHQCVKLNKYDTERVVAFIPPDGVFQLMTYRVTENIFLPFKIFPLLQERSDTRMECMVLLKALFPKPLSATNVEVVIPCPPNLCGVHILHVGAGKALLELAQEAVVWKIRRLSGCSDHLLRYEIQLSPTQTGLPKKEGGLGGTPKMPLQQFRWKRPPLTLRFTLHMFTPSGVCIRYLKITEKSNYRAVKWIRYVTKAGTYQHRL